VPDVVQPVERKLSAIFAADIAGYSRLMAHDEVGTLARLKACRTIIDGLIAIHRGRIFNTAGDSVVADFASAVDAVACAVAAQNAIAAEDPGANDGERMRFRIGVHVGDVMVDGPNLLGDGVNIAARLEALAEPGAICVSAAARDQVGNKLPVVFTDLGEQAVKNIPQPIRAYRVDNAPTGAPTLVTALPLPDKPSIAVLPFQNMSGDPEQEFFADGMVEDITTALSKLRWFFVIARNTSFTYKGRAVDVKQVGRELGVRYVLEGSVRRGGNRLRITAQLVEAESGNHVWAERYDRDVADIFSVQDEITERVVAAVEPELYAAENIRSQRKPPESLDAWECVIRALTCMGQGTREASQEAEVLCRRAIAIFPGYGQAHSLLAWSLLRRSIWGGAFMATVPEVSAELRLALSLDDRDPWAHVAQGMLCMRLRQPDEALRAWRWGLELNPNFALAHAVLALALLQKGSVAEATESAERAMRLSPHDRLVGIYSAFATAMSRLGAGRYDEAIAAARRFIERTPGDIRGYFVLASALALSGDQEGASMVSAALLRLQPAFSIAWGAENLPWSGDIGDRLKDGLRRAGIPEQ
jgi:TolB-like protein/Flp pilus assembly protein TadD